MDERLRPVKALREATLRTFPPWRPHVGWGAFVAFAGALLLFTSLAFYGQWVISGVVEEKNNRVVEVILSAVPARHLLAGKVIGIGSLGLAQLVLVAGLAAGLLVVGVFDAPTELGGDIALVVPWFVLGFALYAVAYAVAGALASSQQNAETAGQPVTYTLLAVFWAGYLTLSTDAEGPLASLLTVFPLSAPLVLPARSALVVTVGESAPHPPRRLSRSRMPSSWPRCPPKRLRPSLPQMRRSHRARSPAWT